MFSAVPRTYELVNHVLTLGFDIRWRRAAVRLAIRGDERIRLDVCTGTGEMAALLRASAPSSCVVMGIDFSGEMLRHARRTHKGSGILWISAALPLLPVREATADLVTISFATRNLCLSREALVAAFADVRRTLRPGGRMLIVETSQPRNRLLRLLFHTYVRAVVRPMGTLISGTSRPYAYLASTILRFYDADQLAGVLADAGFEPVTHRPLLGGVAAVHTAHSGHPVGT